MPLAEANRRGAVLNWRLAVNGIHQADRSSSLRGASSGTLGLLEPLCVLASSDVRVHLPLAGHARMRHRPQVRRADALGELPEGAGAVAGHARRPVALAVFQLDRVDLE